MMLETIQSYSTLAIVSSSLVISLLTYLVTKLFMRESDIHFISKSTPKAKKEKPKKEKSKSRKKDETTTQKQDIEQKQARDVKTVEQKAVTSAKEEKIIVKNQDKVVTSEPTETLLKGTTTKTTKETKPFVVTETEVVTTQVKSEASIPIENDIATKLKKKKVKKGKSAESDTLVGTKLEQNENADNHDEFEVHITKKSKKKEKEEQPSQDSSGAKKSADSNQPIVAAKPPTVELTKEQLEGKLSEANEELSKVKQELSKEKGLASQSSKNVEKDKEILNNQIIHLRHANQRLQEENQKRVQQEAETRKTCQIIQSELSVNISRAEMAIREKTALEKRFRSLQEELAITEKIKSGILSVERDYETLKESSEQSDRELRNKIESMEREKQLQQQQSKRLEAELVAIQGRMHNAESEYQKIRVEMSSITKERDGLRAQLENTRSSLVDASVLREAESKVCLLEKETRECRALNNELTTNQEKLQKEIGEHITKYEAKASVYEELRENHEKLENMLKEKELAETECKEKMDYCAVSLDALKKDYEKLQLEKSSSETGNLENVSSEAALKDASRKVEELQKNLDMESAKTKSALEEKDALEKEVEKFKNVYKELEDRSQSESRALASIKEVNKVLMDDVEKLKSDLEKTVESSKKECLQEKEKYSLLEQEKCCAEERVQKLKASVEDFQKQCADLGGENDTLNIEVERLNKEVQQFQRKAAEETFILIDEKEKDRSAELENVEALKRVFERKHSLDEETINAVQEEKNALLMEKETLLSDLETLRCNYKKLEEGCVTESHVDEQLLSAMKNELETSKTELGLALTENAKLQEHVDILGGEAENYRQVFAKAEELFVGLQTSLNEEQAEWREALVATVSELQRVKDELQKYEEFREQNKTAGKLMEGDVVPLDESMTSAFDDPDIVKVDEQDLLPSSPEDGNVAHLLYSLKRERFARRRLQQENNRLTAALVLKENSRAETAAVEMSVECEHREDEHSAK